jgi:hypothetical protein
MGGGGLKAAAVAGALSPWRLLSPSSLLSSASASSSSSSEVEVAEAEAEAAARDRRPVCAAASTTTPDGDLFFLK